MSAAEPAVIPKPAHVFLAAQKGNLEMVKFLVSKGASPTTPSSTGCTPIGVAALQGNLEMVKFLVSVGVSPIDPMPNGDTPLGCASYNGHVETMEFLLDQGANLDGQNRGGTALFLAAQQGHEEAVIFLLILGADPNILGTLAKTESPIVCASKYGYTGIVEALVAGQADVHARDGTSGGTSLYWAAWGGHTDTATLLLSLGLRSDAPASNGTTPLNAAEDFSLNEGNKGCFNLFINHSNKLSNMTRIKLIERVSPKKSVSTIRV